MTSIPLPPRLRASLFPEGVSLRKIAMPVEHGGWGILIEPIVLGLAAAPSGAGGVVALAAVAAFFARQPLKIGLIDRTRGRIYPRTRAAFALAAVFGAAAAGLGAVAVALGGTALLAVAAIAVPIAIVQIVFDARNDSRNVTAEMAGATAMSGVVAAIALAAGGGWLLAATLWALMLARSLPAILYIRARIRLERAGAAPRAGAVTAHLLAAVAAVGLVLAGTAPVAAAVVMTLLLGRCLAGLSPLRRKATAKRIGYTEVAWGTLAILSIAIAYAL